MAREDRVCGRKASSRRRLAGARMVCVPGRLLSDLGYGVPARPDDAHGARRRRADRCALAGHGGQGGVYRGRSLPARPPGAGRADQWARSGCPTRLPRIARRMLRERAGPGTDFLVAPAGRRGSAVRSCAVAPRRTTRRRNPRRTTERGSRLGTADRAGGRSGWRDPRPRAVQPDDRDAGQVHRRARPPGRAARPPGRGPGRRVVP